MNLDESIKAIAGGNADALKTLYNRRKQITYHAVAFSCKSFGSTNGLHLFYCKGLGRYLNAYMNDRPFMSSRLIEQMFEPVWQFDHHEGYALGWGKRKEKGYSVIEHGDDYQGVSAYLCLVPSERLGVVVLSNHDKTPSQTIC